MKLRRLIKENRILYSIAVFLLDVIYRIKYFFFYLYHLHSSIHFFKGKTQELVITQRLGGGIEKYIQTNYHRPSETLILRNYSMYSDYLFSLESLWTGKIIYILPFQIKRIGKHLSHISVMSLASYCKPSRIFSFISKNKGIVPYTFYLHDFHSLCPTVNLIHENAYCHEQCQKYNCIFPTSSYYTNKSISYKSWQHMWNTFFYGASKIICFSSSSREIFLHVYSQYASKIFIQPHDTSFIVPHEWRGQHQSFTIGIFGNIVTEGKGIRQVADFLSFSAGKEYRIILHGSFPESYRTYASNITYCGRYDSTQLSNIIDKDGIGVVFFPSICPETFSYTVSELIATGIPIACFDAGAQAEKIRSYEKGMIISDYTCPSILKALRTLYDIYNRKV